MNGKKSSDSPSGLSKLFDSIKKAYKKATSKTYLDKNGYLRFKDSNKLVHRWVMEKRVRRKLKKNEDVHHIDGNKLNNDISNLRLMKAENHHQLHLDEWEKSDFETCPRCRKKLVKREGKAGSFWGCTGYPDCRYTRDFKGK